MEYIIRLLAKKVKEGELSLEDIGDQFDIKALVLALLEAEKQER